MAWEKLAEEVSQSRPNLGSCVVVLPDRATSFGPRACMSSRFLERTTYLV